MVLTTELLLCFLSHSLTHLLTYSLTLSLSLTPSLSSPFLPLSLDKNEYFHDN